MGHGIADGEVEAVVGFGKVGGNAAEVGRATSCSAVGRMSGMSEGAKVACREGVAAGTAATGEDVWVGRGIGRRVSGHFLHGTAVDGAGT